jgi:hypothetical protein
MLPHVHSESKRDKVAYLHAVLGYCPLSTLKQGINNGWIDVMAVTTKDVEMNPPRVHITARGYMKMSIKISLFFKYIEIFLSTSSYTLLQ